jgi:hypothetical protein
MLQGGVNPLMGLNMDGPNIYITNAISFCHNWMNGSYNESGLVFIETFAGKLLLQGDELAPVLRREQN